MGIAGFSSWLRERYPEAFDHLPRGSSFDHVYIDLPSTLHSIVRMSRSQTGYHVNLHRRLDELLALLRPKRRVMLALDGPAPLAKLLEQRRRRNREANRLESEGLERLTGTSTSRRRNNAISPLALTTGTTFMLDIHSSLLYYICLKLSDRLHQHLQFEFSDSNVKGEGELKILSRLLHDMETQPNESHLVVGADSDLMLMLMIAGERNVALCADIVISPRSRMKHPSRALVFNRDALENTWRKEHVGANASNSEVTDLALNLALLAILANGNDYLPACVGGLSLRSKGRPGLWNLYLDMRRQPEWKGQSLVRRVCSGCNTTGKKPTLATEKLGDTSMEENTIEESSCGTDQMRNACSGEVRITVNRPMLVALLQRHYHQRLSVMENSPLPHGGKSFTGRWGERSWKGSWDFGPPPDPDFASKLQTPVPSSPATHARLAADPEAYFEGLMWVLSMYSTGKVSNYRYTYNGGSVPVLQLIAYLKETTEAQAEQSKLDAGNERGSSSNISSSKDESKVPIESKKVKERYGSGGGKALSYNRSIEPLIPAACALALLPARGRLLAAKPLRHLMDADSPVAEIYAVCKECQRLASQLRAVGTEFENVRRELATLQGALAGAPLDSEEAVYAEEDIASAVKRCEHAQDRLRGILAELSRSQKEHLISMHPFKPFPTTELEAAVKAVPIDKYSMRERRLMKFGREMLFTWSDDEGSQEIPTEANLSIRIVDGINGAAKEISLKDHEPSLAMLNRPNLPVGSEASSAKASTSPPPLPISQEEFKLLPSWLKDCARFAQRHPRLGDPSVIKLASRRIHRRILPLHPYMVLFSPGARMENLAGIMVKSLCQVRLQSSYSGEMDRYRAGLLNGQRSLHAGAARHVQAAAAPSVKSSSRSFPRKFDAVLSMHHSGKSLGKQCYNGLACHLAPALVKGMKLLRGF